jgi:hypothetical protein
VENYEEDLFDLNGFNLQDMNGGQKCSLNLGDLDVSAIHDDE